ncbi:MAG: diguanylate cyclase [Rhizobium sp.]|nr:diguanylate cyclase [Rhizobium sp.]
MNPASWLAPLESVAILGSVVAAWICLRNLAPSRWPRLGGIAFAVSMGIGTIIVMSTSVELAPGVRFDFRTSLLSAAALIGGPVTILASAMAVAYRIYLGGAGMASGVANIALVTLLGLAFHYRASGREPSTVSILLLAVASSLVGLLVSPMLLPDVFAKVTIENFLGLSAFKAFGTAFCALVLRQDSINRRTGAENRVYRQIFETLPDSLNVKDAAGRFLLANPATAVLMRAGNSANLAGKTDFDFYPAAVAERFRQQEATIIAEQQTVTLDQLAVLPDGEERHLVTLKAPMFDASGAFIGLITHNRDVTETNALKRDLASARGKLQDAIDNMSDGLAMYDKAGHLLYVNQRCHALFPLSGHLLVPGAHIAELAAASLAVNEGVIAGHDATKWLSDLGADTAPQKDILFQRFDGRWISTRITVVEDGILFIISDVTEARNAQAEREQQMREYQALFENSVAGIYRSTVDGRMLKANAALVRLNGFSSETEMLEGVRDIAKEWYVNPARRDDFKRIMASEGRVTDFVSEVYRYRTRERIWVSETAWNVASTDGNPACYEGTVIEVTDRKHAEDEIHRTNLRLLSLAATDGLTGLMNRRSFDEILDREFTSASSQGRSISLIMIDVDHFKPYNDRYGHQAGDDCLRFLAQILMSVCRTPSDIACRYGGEELAVILPDTSASAALIVARRLAESVRGLNLRHEGSSTGIVTVSAGIATASPDQRMSPAALIRHADEALYAAKASGRDRVEVHVPGLSRPTGTEAAWII